MIVVAGVGYRMRVHQMTWAKDNWRILPNFDVWVEAHSLVSDGMSFTVERYYRARTSLDTAAPSTNLHYCVPLCTMCYEHAWLRLLSQPQL